MKWLRKRLAEPSTWRGLVWLLAVAGIALTPEQAEAIVVAGMAVAGLLGVFLPDEEQRHALPPIALQAQSQPEHDSPDAQRQRLGLGPAIPRPGDGIGDDPITRRVSDADVDLPARPDPISRRSQPNFFTQDLDRNANGPGWNG